MRAFLHQFAAALCALAALVLVMVALDHFAPKTQAQSYVQDTSSAPPISLTPDQLRKFWSSQAFANGVTTDAQWNAAMAQIFSAANFPGVNATSLAFLRSFFVQLVHVGIP